MVREGLPERGRESQECCVTECCVTEWRARTDYPTDNDSLDCIYRCIVDTFFLARVSWRLAGPMAKIKPRPRGRLRLFFFRAEDVFFLYNRLYNRVTRLCLSICSSLHSCSPFCAALRANRSRFSWSVNAGVAVKTSSYLVTIFLHAGNRLDSTDPKQTSVATTHALLDLESSLETAPVHCAMAAKGGSRSKQVSTCLMGRGKVPE